MCFVHSFIFCASAAWVLPGLPHQKGLRRDRAEHLSPQPRLRSHVLTLDLQSLTAESVWRGWGGCVKDRLRRWRTVVLLCFLITCSAMDVWDEKEIQNIKKRRETTKKKRPDETDRLENLLWMFLFFSFSVLFVFQNEGKWLESQNNLKNISGSVDSKDGVWWRFMTKALMVIFWHQNILFIKTWVRERSDDSWDHWQG